MRLGRGEAGDDGAVAADIVDIGDPLTAATGAAIFIGRGDLAIAVGADGEDELFACGKFCHSLAGQRRFVLVFLPRPGAPMGSPTPNLGADAVEEPETRR